MIIVDSALRRREREGNPIRVGMVGAGAMGRAITLQISTAIPGMQVVAIANRHVQKACQAYNDAGIDTVHHIHSRRQLEETIARGACGVTDEPELLCEAENVDAIFEVTGSVDFGARIVLKAVEHRKHVITMNAELHATLGPILKTYADRAGVMFTDSDGDQPGVIMNLYRFVKSIGCNPVMAGNIKGLHDAYRNPTTQETFARTHGLSPQMAASFADGTKVSFEMAIVANATGLKVGRRGMYGPSCEDVQQAAALFPIEQLLGGGLVDYIVGARPAPGVFVLGYQEHPIQRHFLKLYKLGDGPLYTFYTPYHLCHLEAPLTIARAVLLADAAVAPIGGPVVEVVATAKRDLQAGEMLDGIGWYTTYGQCENAADAKRERLLPMGLAEGCRLIRDLARDTVLTYDDVELPHGRLSDVLRTEQERRFASDLGSETDADPLTKPNTAAPLAAGRGAGQ